MCEMRLKQQMDTCSRAIKVCDAVLVLAYNICSEMDRSYLCATAYLFDDYHHLLLVWTDECV